MTASPRRAMVHHEGSPLSVPVSGTSLDYGSINSTGYTLFSLPCCSEHRSYFHLSQETPLRNDRLGVEPSGDFLGRPAHSMVEAIDPTGSPDDLTVSPLIARRRRAQTDQAHVTRMSFR
jgi:hypothetical protein